MNYIVLEGASLCLFLLLVLLLVGIAAVCLINTVIIDRKNYTLETELNEEKEKTAELSRANFKLKLLCGVLDIDE